MLTDSFDTVYHTKQPVTLLTKSFPYSLEVGKIEATLLAGKIDME